MSSSAKGTFFDSIDPKLTPPLPIRNRSQF
jgi:hypothetical protein